MPDWLAHRLGRSRAICPAFSTAPAIEQDRNPAAAMPHATQCGPCILDAWLILRAACLPINAQARRSSIAAWVAQA